MAVLEGTIWDPGISRANVTADGIIDFIDQARQMRFWRLGTNNVAYDTGTVGICAGAATVHTRVPTPSAISAHVYDQDFNYGVWVWIDADKYIPPAIVAGQITSSRTFTLHIWNNAETLTIASLNLTNLSGVTVTIDGGRELPITLRHEGELTLTVTVSADGAGTLSGSIDIGFDAPIGVPVTGTRIVLWPFDANWSTAVEVDLIYACEIKSSQDLHEQRSLGGTKPQRVLRYQLTHMGGDDLQFARAQGFRAGTRFVGVPLWTDTCYLTSDAPAGAVTLQVTDTATRDFVVGGQCMLYRDAGTYAIADVLAIDADTITINPVLMSFQAQDRVLPLLVCDPVDDTTHTLITDRHGTAKCEFSEARDRVGPAIGDPTWPTYLDIPVFSFDADWTVQPTDKLAQDLRKTQYGYGRNSIFAGGSPPLVPAYTVTGFSRESRCELQNAFGSRNGRFRSFWMADVPTLLTPTADIVGTALITKAIGYASKYNDAIGSSRKYIAIVLSDGSVLARKILSVLNNGNGTETYELDAAVAATRGQIARVSWLLLVRFFQDKLTLKHIDDQKWQAALAFQELPYEVPA